MIRVPYTCSLLVTISLYQTVKNGKKKLVSAVLGAQMTPIWMIFLYFTINLHESWVKLNKSCLQGLIITTTCSLSTSNGTVLPPSEKVPCPIKVSRYNCRFQCISMASSGFSPPCHRVIMIVWPPKLDSILKSDHPSIHLGHLKHTFARRIFCYSPMTVPTP